jgi:diguanylate cyclase (GGDEF)-like protein
VRCSERAALSEFNATLSELMRFWQALVESARSQIAGGAMGGSPPAELAWSPGAATGGHSHDLLTAVLESIHAGVCVWDADLRLVTCNSSFRKIYDLPDEVVGAGTRLVDLLDHSAHLFDERRSAQELEAHTREELAATGKLELDRTLVDGRVISINYHAFSGGSWIAIYRDVTERRRTVLQLQESERQLKLQNMQLDASLNSMPHGFSIWDEDRRLILWNKRYTEIYHLSADRMHKGMTLYELCEAAIAAGGYPGKTPAEAYEISAQRFDQASTPTTVRSFERDVHGRTINSTYMRSPGFGWVATHEDVTDYQAQLELAAQREAALAQQNVRFDAAINNMPQSLVMFDREYRLVICNRNYARIYGLPPEMVTPGTPLADIINYRLAHGTHPVESDVDYFKHRLEIAARGKPDVSTVELQDGRTVMIRHQPMPDGGWVSTQEDISEQRLTEARIRHLARHDPLTDLPNRSSFREQMELAVAAIGRGETVAVLCVDLDHFKGVNDTLGHSLGDSLLEAVAERLKACARETDIVGRLGGDEFAILQGDSPLPEDAAALARRVVERLAEPFDIDGHHILIGASIGIAVAPADGRDAGTLMKNADLALYRAKGEGRGAFHFFEPDMEAAVRERRAIEVGLRLALARNELRLVYQPLLSLRENRITGFEALIRWDHPTRGTVSPEEFVPVAEETGLIIPIGEWVLRQACIAASSWSDDVTVAVNLSPIQFKNRNLIHHVTDALAESGLPAHRLELEITESLLLSDSDLTIKILHQLRKLGIGISMDDFGTGYSSLSHLRSFPFDKIKIDRSFVHELSSRGDSAAIVTAVIGLGRSLGITTTAEGVETEAQLEMVREQGCSEVQGFLFSPPLPAAAVSRLLAAKSPVALVDPMGKAAS